MADRVVGAAARASEPALSPSARWLPIKGYEGRYSVSSDGRVRSERSGKILVGVPDSTGYPMVKLYLDGKDTHYKVHRLVCRAFHGEAPDGHEVGHLDGSKTNAAAENLKWVTKVENAAHAKAHGTARGFTDVAGERHPRAKLTDAEVASFRARAEAGESVTVLAKEFGINRPYAFALRAGSRRPVPVSAHSGDGQAQGADPSREIGEIQIVFGAPVHLSRSDEAMLLALADRLCAAYRLSHPERMMWTMGVGARVTEGWSDEASFDDSVFQIDCAERERFDTDPPTHKQGGHPMSKIVNHRVEMQESEDYRFGWGSAERGEPRPDWATLDKLDSLKLGRQRLGWEDFHSERLSL